MGIHGIYKEIGPGQRIALSKLAVDKFEETGRPLRIAIDISIWLFQIQASKGGTNPALRTFYYRLLRLISHSIHLLFVFDGPNKPPFKRSKRTGPNVAIIPEFLAKQLLRQFGLVFHVAPGEAEAECALLQNHGIVDAVLSEDVDTLMFGSGVTLRNWTSETGRSNKTPSHVNLYNAETTKERSGLDREGMILIALMSGGDYVPEGIPGCGPKIACEAARAGFGHELYKINKKDKIALNTWREKLAYEIRTNESKFFKCKHKALQIPDDFPNPDVLGYYTTPCVSSLEKVERLRQSLKWDEEINFVELRTFVGDAFDWNKLGGAKKFIRNLAPALLVRELRMRGQDQDRPHEEITKIEEQEAKLVAGIHGRRHHAITDGVPELRLSFVPHDLVPIDLSAEEPDDAYPEDDSEDEGGLVDVEEAPASPSKRRGPSTYDPTKPEKIWVFETYAKVGVPLKAEDWEASQRAKKDALDKRAANKRVPKPAREKSKQANAGSLDAFMKITKSGQPTLSLSQPSCPTQVVTMSVAPKEPLFESDSQGRTQTKIQPAKKLKITAKSKTKIASPTAVKAFPKNSSTQQQTVIDLLSSSPTPLLQRVAHAHSRFTSLVDDQPLLVTKRRRPLIRRTETDTGSLDKRVDLRSPPRLKANSTSVGLRIPPSLSSPTSPSQVVSAKRTKRDDTKSSLLQEPRTPSRGRRQETIDIFSSPSHQTDITNFFTPSNPRHVDTSKYIMSKQSDGSKLPTLNVKTLDLTGSPVQGKLVPSISNDPDNAVQIRPRPAENQFWRDAHYPSSFGTKESGSQLLLQPPRKQPKRPKGCIPPPSFRPSGELDLTEPKPIQATVVEYNARTVKAKSGTGRPSQSSTRRSPRFKPTFSYDRDMATPHITAKRKQIIRVRDSLPGAFAIEEVNLTGESPIARGIFTMASVNVLDLTGL